MKHASFLDKDVLQNFTVLELDAPRRVLYESKEGSFPLVVTRTVEDLGGGKSRFTETVEGDAGKILQLGGAVASTRKRTITRDFEALKKLLEGN